MERNLEDYFYEDDVDETYFEDSEEEEERLVIDCGFAGCLMPGEHFPSECHSAEMIVQQELHAERNGKRCPDGDWVGDKEPGGMECGFCQCIFISDDGRPNCKVCHDALKSIG